LTAFEIKLVSPGSAIGIGPDEKISAFAQSTNSTPKFASIGEIRRDRLIDDRVDAHRAK